MTVTLNIEDEVNIKFDGLPADARRKLVNAFMYEIPGAKFTPSYKLGRWDGMAHHFTIGGSGYIAQLDRIMPILAQMGIGVDHIVDKREKIEISFDPIDENYWANLGKVWPEGHLLAGQPIMLRDYQVDAINTFLKQHQASQILCTGAGKTITSATLVHLCEKYGRTITIVPNKSLIEQTLSDFISVGLDVGVYFGDKKELGKTHTICTWQSFNILDKNKKNSTDDFDKLTEFLHGVKAILVDELHLASGAALTKILSTCAANAPIRWGFTGTLPKEKHQQDIIFACVGPVVGGVSASDLQELGVLAGCHINIIQTQETVAFKSYTDELKFLVSDPTRLDYIAKLCGEIVETGNTLVLVDRIETGKYLEERIPGSVFVSGTVKSKDRKKEYDQVNMATDKIIIATMGVASTGINLPNLHNVMLFEAGKSFVRVIQSIGRGLRKYTDKNFVNIWDITSSCKYSKRHLTERKSYYKEANYEFSVKKIDYKD